MKLEAGMYVKCKNGNIARVIKIDENYPDFLTKYYFDNVIGTIYVSQYYYPEPITECNHTHLDKYILKEPSYEIKDLLEVGDYVNGRLVTGFHYNKTPNKCYVLCDGDLGRPYILIKGKDIKSIVTKEQFDSMKYEVSK